MGNLEEKIETVIRNAGYDPDTELSYGVNWAYMSSRLEETDPMTVLILICVVAVILVTGYLIIYNIFQISVISDIRFYGLLKTIGTTKRQIRRLVRRQALMLSAVGIPLGLAAGYGIGALVLPFMLSFSDYDGMEVALQFQPWILLCGAGFSAFTVYLSSRKPGRIAGSVSPIEAVRYTQEGASDRGSLKEEKAQEEKRRPVQRLIHGAFQSGEKQAHYGGCRYGDLFKYHSVDGGHDGCGQFPHRPLYRAADHG